MGQYPAASSTSPLGLPPLKMAKFQILVVLLAVMMIFSPSSDAAPAPAPVPNPAPVPLLFDKLFPRAMARARANDRGAKSFAGGSRCRVGGAVFNPDPFANPGSAPFPAAPICFWGINWAGLCDSSLSRLLVRMTISDGS